MKHCHYCGTAVTDKDYYDIGHQRIYVCGSAECDREARDHQREVIENAAYEAAQDDYGRYY